MAATISINGVTYEGNSISISNGVIRIDDKMVDTKSAKRITIDVNGSVESVKVDSCDRLFVAGDVGSFKTTSGSLSCGDVNGDVNTVSGSVKCGKVAGSVKTVSGSVSSRS